MTDKGNKEKEENRLSDVTAEIQRTMNPAILSQETDDVKGRGKIKNNFSKRTNDKITEFNKRFNLRNARKKNID